MSAAALEFVVLIQQSREQRFQVNGANRSVRPTRLAESRGCSSIIYQDDKDQHTHALAAIRRASLPTVEVKAGTIAEALSGLVSKHPDLRRHLYTEDGKLRSFVNVYLNDEDVRYLQKEATAVKDSDTISIVPSIAGGW